jgi:hypothetical protein
MTDGVEGESRESDDSIPAEKNKSFTFKGFLNHAKI